jgi:FKBP-type peptidyl-prolyl cis-trans isomerase
LIGVPLIASHFSMAPSRDQKANSGATASTRKVSGSGPAKVLDKVIAACRELQDDGKGNSRQAIAKYLLKHFEYSNPVALKKALKKGVKGGILHQTGQSFRVAGDPVKQAQPEDTVQIKDIPTGEEVKESQAATGDAITVSYVGKLGNGYEFDRSKSFTFVLGAGEVIKGWDQGLEGMLLGGRRTLVVPSKFGYGKRGCAPDIPGGATLHFTVFLKKVQKHKD